MFLKGPVILCKNLTTTLLKEIIQKQIINLPSGNAKFNWIGVLDIGEFSSEMVRNFSSYKNKEYEVTCSANMCFSEVASLLAKIIGKKLFIKA